MSGNGTMKLDIIDLLKLKDLPTDKGIKFVRHQDSRKDIDFEKIVRERKYLETYQKFQGKPVFHDCDYIVSFIGYKGTQAKFIGVYKVNGKIEINEEFFKDIDFPNSEIIKESKFYYKLEKVPGYDDLEDRIIIDWGKATIVWHQWMTPREIVEILPKGYVKYFPGYLELILMYDDLVQIAKKHMANRDWHTMLSSVAGVYLILDTMTGKQYIGSAYGEAGILGRWKGYADTGHGGDAELEKLLVKEGKDYAKNFQFTILQPLPRTLTAKEVIEYESRYKKKLGTRAFGLNLN